MKQKETMKFMIRNAGNYKGVRSMEALVRRSAVQVRDLDRSQELGVLYESAEIEQEIG